MDDRPRRPCRPLLLRRRARRPGPPRVEVVAAERVRPVFMLGIDDATRASRGARRRRTAR